MANNVQSRIRVIICLAGLGIFVMGVLLSASGIMIADLLPGDEVFSGLGTNCQYWAGIPIIVTGTVLLITICLKRYGCLKYVSTCCVLIALVLSLLVIVEESSESAAVDSFINGMMCKPKFKVVIFNTDESCDKLRSAKPWYPVMLFTSAIAIGLCIAVLFALFADWMLFYAMKSSYREYLMSGDSIQAVPQSDYARFSAPDALEQPIWNAQYESAGGMSLRPV